MCIFLIKKSLNFEVDNTLIVQHLPKDANKYEITLMIIYAFSQKLREKKRAYDINRMSKKFEMTILKVNVDCVYLNSLCRNIIIFARPRPRSTTTSHILKK